MSSIFCDPAAYADPARWHDEAARLRRDDPVHLVNEPGFRPFYAVTRHADVTEVERQHDKFHNTLDSVLQQQVIIDARNAKGAALRTLIHMDGDDHKNYRGVTAEWFKPASLRRLEGRIAEMAAQTVDHMLSLGGSCDAARDVAMNYPLQVIMSILGVPDSDLPRMLTLTQELFGSEDPETRRGTTPEEQMEVIIDFAMYFNALTASRREQPTEDVASVIANATINGVQLGDLETMSYYVIIASAGHDTTSSSISGGIEQFARHPEQWAALRSDPSLVNGAVDEIIRWEAPVKHFMRTAQEDYTLASTPIAAGDSLLMSYWSANRDETFFDDPFTFDIRRRNADKHLAFGTGLHFCLGAQMARIEMRAFFAELARRVETLSLNGEPERTKATFVSGLKRLPIAYTAA